MTFRNHTSHRVLLVSGDSELIDRFSGYQQARPAVGESDDLPRCGHLPIEVTIAASAESAFVAMDASKESGHPYEVAVIDSAWLGAATSGVCRKLWDLESRLGIIDCGADQRPGEISRLFEAVPRPGNFVVLRRPFLVIELVSQVERMLERNVLETRGMQMSHDLRLLARSLERSEAECQSQRRHLKRLRLERLETTRLNGTAGSSSELHEVLAGESRAAGPAVRRLSTEPVERTGDGDAEGPLEIQTGPNEECSRIKGRILIAEDVPMNLKLLTFLLENAGAEVVSTTDGTAALAAYDDSVSSGDHFSLIMLDIVMPGIDGHECCRELRRRGFEGPIVAITGRTATLDRKQCFRAGCDDYLPKPIDRNLLISTAQRLMSGSTASRDQQILDAIDAAVSPISRSTASAEMVPS